MPCRYCAADNDVTRAFGVCADHLVDALMEQAGVPVGGEPVAFEDLPALRERIEQMMLVASRPGFTVRR